MAIEVSIPTPLRGLTNNQDIVHVAAGNVSDLINDLNTQFPGIKERLVDDQGNLRRFVNFYVNGEDVRFLDDKNSVVKDGDEVTIVPAIAGG
ncbi:MAG: MoaD/ThiS family protein [Blastochloris sp.]|jgi:MoaD family protein|nr:MoaD/ThiS family protein [Blastochloris sp.]